MILPDYADQISTGKPLKKVGINNFAMFRNDFNDERVLTNQAAYVSLRSHNGIHMSRVVGILLEYEGQAIDIDDGLLEALSDSHINANAYWECKWPCVHHMENDQPLLVQCGLEGRLIHNKRGKHVTEWYLTTKVPYTSVCPCSHEMVRKAGHGIPHMQRALATITGLVPSNTDDLDEFMSGVIAATVEAVGLVPQPFMKRTHELEWCQRADDNNLFVEDAARVIADALDGWYRDIVVVCEHEESIHLHNVVGVYAPEGSRLT
jgi:GTP cyclohydrolase FolE2